jgi:NIPSNAP
MLICTFFLSNTFALWFKLNNAERNLMIAPIKSARGKSSSSGSSMPLFELRYYECVPGKLNDLLRRFQHYAIPIRSEYGIRSMGFWTTVIGENDQSLYYMLIWKSFAEREIKNGRSLRRTCDGSRLERKRKRTAFWSCELKNSTLRAADIKAVKGFAFNCEVDS